MHTPSRVLVLSPFDFTRDEIRVNAIEIGKDVLTINPNADFFWDCGTSPTYSKLSNISAVFDNMNLSAIDTLICNVCEEHANPIYPYIRELARMCGIQVLTAKELHEIAKEY